MFEQVDLNSTEIIGFSRGFRAMVLQRRYVKLFRERGNREKLYRSIPFKSLVNFQPSKHSFDHAIRHSMNYYNSIKRSINPYTYIERRGAKITITNPRNSLNPKNFTIHSSKNISCDYSTISMSNSISISPPDNMVWRNQSISTASFLFPLVGIRFKVKA